MQHKKKGVFKWVDYMTAEERLNWVRPKKKRRMNYIGDFGVALCFGGLIFLMMIIMSMVV